MTKTHNKPRNEYSTTTIERRVESNAVHSGVSRAKLRALEDKKRIGTPSLNRMATSSVRPRINVVKQLSSAVFDKRVDSWFNFVETIDTELAAKGQSYRAADLSRDVALVLVDDRVFDGLLERRYSRTYSADAPQNVVNRTGRKFADKLGKFIGASHRAESQAKIDQMHANDQLWERHQRLGRITQDEREELLEHPFGREAYETRKSFTVSPDETGFFVGFNDETIFQQRRLILEQAYKSLNLERTRSDVAHENEWRPLVRLFEPVIEYGDNVAPPLEYSRGVFDLSQLGPMLFDETRVKIS
jgi:hypothetical protein